MSQNIEGRLWGTIYEAVQYLSRSYDINTNVKDLIESAIQGNLQLSICSSQLIYFIQHEKRKLETTGIANHDILNVGDFLFDGTEKTNFYFEPNAICSNLSEVIDLCESDLGVFNLCITKGSIEYLTGIVSNETTGIKTNSPIILKKDGRYLKLIKHLSEFKTVNDLEWHRPQEAPIQDMKHLRYESENDYLSYQFYGDYQIGCFFDQLDTFTTPNAVMKKKNTGGIFITKEEYDAGIIIKVLSHKLNLNIENPYKAEGILLRRMRLHELDFGKNVIADRLEKIKNGKVSDELAKKIHPRTKNTVARIIASMTKISEFEDNPREAARNIKMYAESTNIFVDERIIESYITIGQELIKP